jgi:tetratricopeptide (TPR) repeat protein
MDALKLSAHIAEDLGDDIRRGHILARQGIIHSKLAEHERALQSFEEYLAITRAQALVTEEAVALGHIANILFQMEKYTEVIVWQQQHLDKVLQIRDEGAEAMIYCNLGICCEKLGRQTEAVSWHMKHLEKTETLQDLEGQEAACSNLGAAYADLGNLQQALVMHQRHLSLARELGDKDSELMALGQLASVLGSQGEHAKQIVCLQESLLVARQVGDSVSANPETLILMPKP